MITEVEQLVCHHGWLLSTRTGEPTTMAYDVEDGMLRLIHDERFDTVGKLQADGSIDWFTNDIYFRTWRRNRHTKGKIESNLLLKVDIIFK